MDQIIELCTKLGFPAAFCVALLAMIWYGMVQPTNRHLEKLVENVDETNTKNSELLAKNTEAITKMGVFLEHMLSEQLAKRNA